MTFSFSFFALALFLSVPYTLAGTSAQQLIQAAQQIPNGNYHLRNMATGQQILNSKSEMFPVYGEGNPVAIASHQSAHTLIAVGNEGDRKCLSAQWSGSSDGVGALYECIVGAFDEGSKSSLRPAKQEFLLVPVNKKFKRSIVTDLVSRSDASIFDDAADVEKRAPHSTSYGPFYIIANDHLGDDGQPVRALQGSKIVSLGQRVMKLGKWQAGTRSQMWQFIRA